MRVTFAKKTRFNMPVLCNILHTLVLYQKVLTNQKNQYVLVICGVGNIFLGIDFFLGDLGSFKKYS